MVGEGTFFAGARQETSPTVVYGEDYRDEPALERLRQLDIKDPKFAFTIKEEYGLAEDGDSEKEPINADVTWLRLPKPEGEEFADTLDVEGKFYLPRGAKNGELIIFTPGFPGGNAGRFEQRYAKAFIDAGYAFFTIRHNGTALIKEDTAPEIINNEKRMDLARSHGERHIGGTRAEGYSPRGIMREPIVPLLALYQQFDKIHLMGQSMGVAASYHAATRVTDHSEIADKLGNIVGVAGYVGKGSGELSEPWPGMKGPMQDLIAYETGYIERVGTNTDPAKLGEELAKAAADNAEMRVPEHVGNVLVFTPADPLIAGPDQDGEEDALRQYGPVTERKLIIRDESALDQPKAHSMLWIKPANLVRAVQAKVSSHGPHYAQIGGDKGLVDEKEPIYKQG